MVVTSRCFSKALSNSFRNFSASFLNLSSLNTKNTREKKNNKKLICQLTQAAGDNQAGLNDTLLPLVTTV